MNSAFVGYEEFCRFRSWWITPSSICRILHILRKPNSIISNCSLTKGFSKLHTFAANMKLKKDPPPPCSYADVLWDSSRLLAPRTSFAGEDCVTSQNNACVGDYQKEGQDVVSAVWDIKQMPPYCLEPQFCNWETYSKYTHNVIRSSDLRSQLKKFTLKCSGFWLTTLSSPFGRQQNYIFPLSPKSNQSQFSPKIST